MDEKDKKQPEVIVDISKWKMRDRLEFNQKAASDDNAAIDFMIEKGVIVDWSFAGEPSDKEAWKELELEDYSVILRAVSAAAQERFRKGL